jgi:spermidine synthase
VAVYGSRLTLWPGLCVFSSLEMSCPPQGFLEESFLDAAKAALVDGGVLAANVVSRAAGAHSSAVAKLQKVNTPLRVYGPTLSSLCIYD